MQIDLGKPPSGPSSVDKEIRQQLEAFNNTSQPYPSDKTLVDIFEEQVSKTPGGIALYLGDAAMTYDALNNRANQLARYLQSQGVQPGDNVGIISVRNFDMIVALFAILKCGGAYVPTEPEYPAERQQYILSRSSVKLVLTNVSEQAQLTGYALADVRTVPYHDYDDSNLHIKIDSRQLAYTIYTSGSTGLPKGVMIEHHSAVNLIHWVNTKFQVGEKDRLLFVTSVCFDLSVYDIFGMLACGGAVVIADKKDVLDLPGLIDMMQRNRITFWDSVPSTMDALVNRIAAADPSYRQMSLRLVFLSGDWIPVALPGKIKEYFPNAKVISLGGATEATVWSNYYPVESVGPGQRSIPYGVPIANNSFYILDEDMKPVPAGEAGELFIGGVGVARGYSGDAEKTAHAFLPDPFTREWGGRMYRTGDLGRMMPGMIMEFIGRKDNQVKIRGYRVELGEVESVVRQYEGIASAAVLYLSDKKQLVGYVVPGNNYDREQLLAHLHTKLPEYMVPNRWVELERMPLTPNGKTDTGALREIKTGETTSNAEIAVAETETEKAIAAEWQKVLGMESIDIHQNFFDLGGQSLLAVELISHMEKALGKELPANILYRHGTVASLAAFVEAMPSAKKWRSLLAVKADGRKTPLYLVPGDGIVLANFHNLAKYLGQEQPMYSFQPIGLSGEEEPDNIPDIAARYVGEMLQQNPSGPYALAGYSFGGYVVIEMKRILEDMGKKVTFLGILDTDAGNIVYKKRLTESLPLRIKRQFPKALFVLRSLLLTPGATIGYQGMILGGKIRRLGYALGIRQKPELEGVTRQVELITSIHEKAFRNYDLQPFDDVVHLFRAKTRVYFIDDFKYLGWANYARKGVKVYEVPGDHKTMFFPPHVQELGRVLQNALDT